jgi:four helix bundle protein
MGNYFKLIVWQKAKELAVRIYKLTQENKISKDFGLRDQLQRAAVSIPANIAEGDELGTDKQSIRHFYIAKGSTAELLTQLIIANEIGYVTKDIVDPLIGECKIISTMLMKIIKARS